MAKCRYPSCESQASLRPMILLVGKCPDTRCTEEHLIGELQAGYIVCEEHRFQLGTNDIVSAQERKEMDDAAMAGGAPMRCDWVHSVLRFSDLPPDHVVDFHRERARRQKSE